MQLLLPALVLPLFDFQRYPCSVTTQNSLLYRPAHLFLIVATTVYLAYESLITFLILTLAGPHLAPFLKPVTRLVLTTIVLVTASRKESLLTVLAATMGALLALGWYSKLPPTYHNWVHFRAEALPQLVICALAGLALASSRQNSRISGDQYE